MKDGMSGKDVLLLNDLAIKVAKPNAVFFEIGSWKGHSASVLGEVAKECGGHVFCVDHWKGSPGVWQHELEVNCLATFRMNIKECGLEDVVHPIVMESALAASIIRDEVADLLFIDADHRYEGIRKDIEIWSSKVKRGGILCGHDCEKYLEDYEPNEQGWIRSATDNDYLDRLNCHAGVIVALHDCFGKDFSKQDGSTIWFKRM